LKGSSTTSARATEPPRATDQSSDRRRSPITVEFALSGPSELPDPATHAYRKDLADIALAGRVIAPHYAQPIAVPVVIASVLRPEAKDDSPAIAEIEPGATFELLDDSLGWAWGYAGPKRLVGYVPSEALRPS
jgi:hypothetical protein